MHLDVCAACAAEATFEAALADTAGRETLAEVPGRRELLWTRLEQAAAGRAGERENERTRERGNEGRRPVSSFSPSLVRSFSRSLALPAAVALALALSVGGRWWSRVPARSVGDQNPRPGSALHAELSLPERQPLIENPMGPTTERLLILLEAAK